MDRSIKLLFRLAGGLLIAAGVVWLWKRRCRRHEASRLSSLRPQPPLNRDIDRWQDDGGESAPLSPPAL